MSQVLWKCSCPLRMWNCCWVHCCLPRHGGSQQCTDADVLTRMRGLWKSFRLVRFQAFTEDLLVEGWVCQLHGNLGCRPGQKNLVAFCSKHSFAQHSFGLISKTWALESCRITCFVTTSGTLNVLGGACTRGVLRSNHMEAGLGKWSEPYWGVGPPAVKMWFLKCANLCKAGTSVPVSSWIRRLHSLAWGWKHKGSRIQKAFNVFVLWFNSINNYW